MAWEFQGSIAFVSSSLQMISEGKSVQSFQVWQLNQKTEVFATGSSLNPIQGSGNHLVPTFPRLGKVSRRGGMKEEPAETPVGKGFLPQERKFHWKDVHWDVSEFKMPREKTE